MKKSEFLSALSERLSRLPREDAEKSLAFYDEMIDDRIEDGVGEEEAVAALGSVDAIVEQILAETPIRKIVKERVKPRRRLRAWEIVLLVLGAPLWIPLLIVAAVLVLVFFILLWVGVIVLAALLLAFAAAACAGIVLSAMYFASGKPAAAVCAIGLSFFFIGLTLLMIPALTYTAIGTAKLCKNITLGIKKLFVGKGRSQ